jgi:hypothetical protein
MLATTVGAAECGLKVSPTDADGVVQKDPADHMAKSH